MKLNFTSVAVAILSAHAQAGVLSVVPRQGGMLMPEVYYHADTDSVTVDLSAIKVIAQLTPLLVSNPDDNFAPTDPWFNYLDPSKQGLAFSRRYGFDMDVMTDYLPENRALWIRNLGSSPELSFFDYNDFVGALTWNPILGTDGTSNSIYWNEVMWHIGVAAPPALPGQTNAYSATMEVYVVNTDTGKEVAHSGSGPFVLVWTDTPDGRPELAIGPAPLNGVTLTWTSSAVNWALVSSTTLISTDWIVVTNPPAVINNQNAVTLDHLGAREFFRLQRNQ